MPEGRASPAPGFWLASLATVAWGGYCGWALNSGGRIADLAADPAQIAVLAAPVAAFYAIAALFGRSQQVPTLAAPDSLAESESRIAGLATRLQALRDSLRADLEGIARATAALDQRRAPLQQLLNELAAATSAASQAQQAFESLLPDAGKTADALIATFAQTADRAGAEADRLQTAAHDLGSELGALERQSTATAESLAAARTQTDAGVRAIRSEADSLFDVLEGTLVAKRKTLIDSSNAMIASLGGRYGEFQALAEKSLREFSQQLSELANAASTIESRLQQSIAATTTLSEQGSAAFQQLNSDIDQTSQSGNARLQALTQAAQTAAATLGDIAAPAAAARQAADALAAALNTTKEEAAGLETALATRIPECAQSSAAAITDLVQHANSLQQAIANIGTDVSSLTAPVDERRAELEAAAASFASHKASIEAAAATLVSQLQQAGQLIDEVERHTRDTSVTAAAGLVDTFNQIRTMSTQATGTMRETIDNLVSEARTALQQAADYALQHGFAEPIARYAAEAESHAATAAERTAASMAALAEALKLIEARIAASHTQLHAAEQQNLTRSSDHLMQQLAEAGIDIAAALDKPMSDSDWRLWQQGERGLFSRRARALLDRRDLKEVGALLQKNDRLAQAARTYVAAFERLASGFSDSVPGLLAALRGSEQGRLAALLTEAMDHQNI